MHFALSHKTHFSPLRQSVRLQHNKCIRHLFGSSLGNPRKRTELEKKFLYTLISLKDRWSWKGTKTRQIWKNARRLPDVYCVFLQMSSSFLAFFHLFLVSVLFSTPLIFKWSWVLEKLFSKTKNRSHSLQQNFPNDCLPSLSINVAVTSTANVL